MRIEQVSKLDPLERLIYWVKERESIRLKKEAGEPPPWTDDEILQRYRFCNVRRMDDKVSQWLMDNWYTPYKDHPNMLVACALARFINKPESLTLLARFVFQDGFPPAWGSIKRELRAAKARGPIFNGAYMVRGNDGKDKVSSVIDLTVSPLSKSPPTITKSSMLETWTQLCPRYGFGPFMAGQIVADLRWAVVGKWKDKHRWAPIGPGSKRGMNRILNRPIESPLSQDDFNDCLNQLMVSVTAVLCRSITRRMEAIDWQNCLCETDKYSRVMLGEGRPKQIYPGERG